MEGTEEEVMEVVEAVEGPAVMGGHGCTRTTQYCQRPYVTTTALQRADGRATSMCVAAQN